MIILFLCSGNIHRSAHAEAILRAEAERDGRTDIEARSAGVIAVAGMEPPPQAITAARTFGIELGAHRSRPAEASLLSRSDLIVVMEGFHLSWVELRHPDLAARCRLLSRHAGEASRALGVLPGDDIPDAIGEDDDSFRRSFGVIQECVRRLYRELPPAPQEVYAEAIETRFRLLRQSPLSLSPADYALVERWWARGVPLWIVLDTLDELLARRHGSADSTRVRRLSYVEHVVEERFASYQQAREGAANPDAAGGDAPIRLTRAAERLNEAARNAVLEGMPEVGDILRSMAERIASDMDRQASDAAAVLRLHEMDEELTRLLVSQIGQEEISDLRDRAAERLAGFRDRMTPEVFEATVTRLVGEQVRASLGLPPIARS